MRIFGIEVKITLLVLVIVASIIATGYLSYKNLSLIVLSIHREARPDYKLIKIKEVAADLSEVDNSVRLYSLTREPKYLKPYDNIISTIDKKVEELLNLQGNDTTQLANIRAIEKLISERLVVWDQIMLLHAKPLEKKVFSEFYNTMEKKAPDTTISIDTTLTPRKSSILRRLFAKKEKERMKEKVYVKEEIKLGKEQVQEEVEKLEKSLKDVAIQQVTTESQLLKKNNELGLKLHYLILQLEQRETESLFSRSIEAENLASTTYKWLAFFCIAAVLFLVIVLFITIDYSRKSQRTQRALQQAKIEADNLVKAKELFTANVSHELRTPMNAIYGLSEQLLQQPMNTKLKEQLTIIKKSADYLNKIVNNILDFSKIEAGKLSIEKIPFSPRSVFQEVCALNQVIADQKKISFECTYKNKLPLQMLGDPTRLKQVLFNLLGNAFKFTEQGEVSVIVETSIIDQTSAIISVTVSDSGIGIPENKLDAIFDDYTQAEQSTNRKYGGTGLGLAIVKRIVTLMNGTITVQSIPNKGTSFTFSIPFEINNVPEFTEASEPLIVPEEIKNLSILVVDDEEYNRFLVNTIFKKWNIKNFKCTTNGKEAVEITKTSNFDIILMDLRMPQMNGYEASAEILKFSPQSKIIALTAGNYADDISKSRELGMVGFILKPFTEKELLSALEGTLASKFVSLNEDVVPEINETDEINFKELYRISGDDDKFVEEMLSLFLKTTLNGVQDLKQGVAVENWSTMAEVAHKMASPCKHLGAVLLYSNLKEIEKMEKDERNINRAKQLVEKIELQVSSISKKIEEKIV
jgi:signal transduction histidine kinase/CheY-like chemotaxis protein/HPt (histidine-containing phosphotransfer) domain-containing protein